MENREAYSNHQVEIPAQCLTSFNSWVPPKPEQIKTACNMAGLSSGSEIGGLVGVSPRTVRKWFGDSERITYAAWALICAEAGFGQIWRNNE